MRSARACFIALASYHVIALNLSPVVAGYGWRNYFLYAAFALVMPAVLQRADVIGVGVRDEPMRLPSTDIERQSRAIEEQAVVPVKHLFNCSLFGGGMLDAGC